MLIGPLLRPWAGGLLSLQLTNISTAVSAVWFIDGSRTMLLKHSRQECCLSYESFVLNYTRMMVLLILVGQSQETCETTVSRPSILRRSNTDLAGHWLAFDIMGDFLVGQNYHTMESHQNRFMIDTIRDMNKRIGIYSQNPSLIYLGWDLIWSPISYKCRRQCLNWMKAMRASLISQYHEESAALLSTAVNPFRSTKEGMPIEDISSEAQFLVAAGTTILQPASIL